MVLAMTPGSHSHPPFRREKLYTLSLTPRFELPKDAWDVVGPILFEGREYVSPEKAYPWYSNAVGYLLTG